MNLDKEEATKVMAEYEALRRLGQYSMTDFLSVQRSACENDFYCLVNFTQNSAEAYSTILKNYAELILNVKAKDIPKAKMLKTTYSV